MKKLYFSLLSLAAFATANAQFAITSTNMPVAGNTYDYRPVDTTTSSPGAAGTGVIWNFTNIVADDSLVLTRSYSAPSSTPYASTFPSSTIAEYTTTPAQQYTYFSGTTSYQMDGLVLTDPQLTATVTLSDAGTIFNTFPFGYGATQYDTLNGTVSTSQGNGTVQGGITTTVDGSGTLDLPGVSFSNVIRVKIYTNLDVSLMGGLFMVNIKMMRYQFYNSQDKFPLYETGWNDMAGSVEEFASLSDFAYVGMKENKAPVFTLYPNPAKNELNIRLLNSSSAAKVDIINQLGQTVKSENITSTVSSVDISTLSKGFYFVRIQNGKDAHTEKLIVE